MFGLDQSESRNLHSTLMTSQNNSKGSRQPKYTAVQTFVAQEQKLFLRLRYEMSLVS